MLGISHILSCPQHLDRYLEQNIRYFAMFDYEGDVCIIFKLAEVPGIARGFFCLKI